MKQQHSVPVFLIMSGQIMNSRENGKHIKNNNALEQQDIVHIFRRYPMQEHSEKY